MFQHANIQDHLPQTFALSQIIPCGAHSKSMSRDFEKILILCENVYAALANELFQNYRKIGQLL